VKMYRCWVVAFGRIAAATAVQTEVGSDLERAGRETDPADFAGRKLSDGQREFTTTQCQNPLPVGASGSKASGRNLAFRPVRHFTRGRVTDCPGGSHGQTRTIRWAGSKGDRRPRNRPTEKERGLNKQPGPGHPTRLLSCDRQGGRSVRRCKAATVRRTAWFVRNPVHRRDETLSTVRIVNKGPGGNLLRGLQRTR
jgi:hypothetical protein